MTHSSNQKPTSKPKDKIIRQVSIKDYRDLTTVVFSIALPVLCVKNQVDWHVRMQFLSDDTKERIDIQMIDTQS